MRDEVLLKKRGLYYRPGWSGYTVHEHEAGRYGRHKAERHIRSVEGVTICELPATRDMEASNG
jgi:hypothetical protein